MARSGYADIGFRTLLKQVFPDNPPKELSADLKRQALFFDQISIYNATWYLEQIRKGPLYSRHSSWLNEIELELEWLAENDVIVDLEKVYSSLPKSNFDEIVDLRKKHAGESFDLIKQHLEDPSVGVDKLVRNLIKGDVIRLREYISSFSNSNDFLVVPALELKNYLYDIPDSRRQYVIEVVINNLPVPSATTSWEKIIEYRQDPQSQKNLLSLRRWISKITFSDLPTSEIEEEYQSLTNEYQSHMHLHKLKSDTETLQTVVKVPFELIEDVIKLRFSKIPEPFFALKKRQISLMEAELKTPGREIAYVLKAREAFPSEE